jgi:hypothetical protein
MVMVVISRLDANLSWILHNSTAVLGIEEGQRAACENVHRTIVLAIGEH